MGEESRVMHPDRAGLSTAEILRTLIDVTAGSRRRSTAAKPYLFMRGSVIPTPTTPTSAASCLSGPSSRSTAAAAWTSGWNGPG
ncbi:hypothetical protein [Streptomyces eurythermus]